MQTYQIPQSQILKQLCTNTSKQIIEKATDFKNRKLVIFCAGPSGQQFYKTMLDDYGIEAEFFIDNNSRIAGNSIFGKPVKYRPWEAMSEFIHKYYIITASSWSNHYQIAEQLDSLGMSEHMSFYSFLTAKIMPRYLTIADMLYDEMSRCSYLASIYNFMTNDNQFVQYAGEQYFSHPKFAKLGEDIIVDAGAYVGDSTEAVITRSNGHCKVYLFEPYEEVHKAIYARKERWCKEWNMDSERIILVPAGLSSTTQNISMYTIGIDAIPFLHKISNGGTSVPAYSLDDFFKDKASPTFIKADIEGSELDMLKGAKNILMNHKPLLAISIYHSPQEMASIAEYLASLQCGYKFDVRNHTTYWADTILYCWI
jgi:FkbM family methyltransferase